MIQIENIKSMLIMSKFQMRSIVSEKFYHIQKNDLLNHLLKSSVGKILEAGKLDTTIRDLSEDDPKRTLDKDLKELTATIYILSQSEIDEIRHQLNQLKPCNNK